MQMILLFPQFMKYTGKKEIKLLFNVYILYIYLIFHYGHLGILQTYMEIQNKLKHLHTHLFVQQCCQPEGGFIITGYICIC